jgi:hypothetical protein
MGMTGCGAALFAQAARYRRRATGGGGDEGDTLTGCYPRTRESARGGHTHNDGGNGLYAATACGIIRKGVLL